MTDEYEGHKLTGGKFITEFPRPNPHELELLDILEEECAETIQRAVKLKRFGKDQSQPGQDLTNADRLADEIGDIFAMVDLLVEARLIDLQRVWDRIPVKKEKVSIYLQEGEDG